MDSTVALEAFVDALGAAGRPESIIATHRSALRRLVRETGIGLLDQTPHSVRRHLQFLRPTTRTATGLYLRNFYRWALAENLIGIDPAPPPGKALPLRDDPLDPAERRTVDLFVVHLRYRNLADATIEHYRRTIRHLRDTLGPLDTVDIAALETYLMRFAPNTRRSEMCRLKNFYRWARSTGHLPADPTVALVSPRVPECLPRPISETDLRRALHTSPRVVRICLLLAGWAGLRAAEIAALSVEDLRFDDEPEVRIAESKGRHEDLIPLSPWLASQLLACELPSAGWLFPKRGDYTVHRDRSSISSSACRHLHTLGIPGGLHSLRFRFATQSYRATRELYVTQALMRHRDPASTVRYTKLDTRDLAEVVALLPQV